MQLNMYVFLEVLILLVAIMHRPNPMLSWSLFICQSWSCEVRAVSAKGFLLPQSCRSCGSTQICTTKIAGANSSSLWWAFELWREGQDLAAASAIVPASLLGLNCSLPAFPLPWNTFILLGRHLIWEYSCLPPMVAFSLLLLATATCKQLWHLLPGQCLHEWIAWVEDQTAMFALWPRWGLLEGK